jgi:hypothetical protein
MLEWLDAQIAKLRLQLCVYTFFSTYLSRHEARHRSLLKHKTLGAKVFARAVL